MVGGDALRTTNVAVADRAAGRVAVTATGQPTDPLAIAVDRLAPQQHHRGVTREPGEHLANATRSLDGDGGPATEIDLAAQFHRPPEPRFHGRVVRPDV